MRPQALTLATAVAAALALPCWQAQAQNTATPANSLAGVSQANALLQPSPLPFNYPPFDKIRDEDFAPALDQGMAEQLAEVQAIVDNPAAPSFENTIVAMEMSGRLLARTSTVLFSLLGADANPARLQLQSRYAARLAAHGDAITLNPKLFERVRQLYAQRASLGLDAEALRLVERYHSSFVRNGAQLSDEQKARIKAINAEMATLGSQFNQKVLAEVNESGLLLDSAEELAGLGAEQVKNAAELAARNGHPGKFMIALLNTTIQPALSQLSRRDVRERLHKASVERGSRGNAHDTTALIARVAELRAERAALLGYPTHAAYVLDDETAKNTTAVNQLLKKLAPPAVAAARREGAELQALIDREQAKLKQASFPLAPWDWSYYAEKLRAEKFGFDESQLKPYLELNQVLENGVFYAAGQLYGLSFKRRHDLPVYHPSVMVYDVFNADGSQLAIFLADMYARPSKRGGAWANGYVQQNRLFGTKPVIANHLNVPVPAEGQPTLLTWDEVNTLFHEFGHALHGMFTQVGYPSFAGRVPRDFVEYPSQVNEMWANWPSVLQHYARHYKTGEAMPQALLDKLQAARRFDQGYATTSYLASAIVDQRWHQLKAGETPKAGAVMDFEAQVLKQEGLDYAPVPPRYRTPYFSHIMGGYSAGYYAYIWSEVLDANTVDWFTAHGGLKRENGERFRAKLLSKGGSVDALQLFTDMVGHAPDIEPLLKRRGLQPLAQGSTDKPGRAAQP